MGAAASASRPADDVEHHLRQRLVERLGSIGPVDAAGRHPRREHPRRRDAAGAVDGLGGDIDESFARRRRHLKRADFSDQEDVGVQSPARTADIGDPARILEGLDQPRLHQPRHAVGPLHAGQERDGTGPVLDDDALAVEGLNGDRFGHRKLTAARADTAHIAWRRQVERGGGRRRTAAQGHCGGETERNATPAARSCRMSTHCHGIGHWIAGHSALTAGRYTRGSVAFHRK